MVTIAWRHASSSAGGTYAGITNPLNRSGAGCYHRRRIASPQGAASESFTKEETESVRPAVTCRRSPVGHVPRDNPGFGPRILHQRQPHLGFLCTPLPPAPGLCLSIPRLRKRPEQRISRGSFMRAIRRHRSRSRPRNVDTCADCLACAARSVPVKPHRVRGIWSSHI